MQALSQNGQGPALPWVAIYWRWQRWEMGTLSCPSTYFTPDFWSKISLLRRQVNLPSGLAGPPYLLIYPHLTVSRPFLEAAAPLESTWEFLRSQSLMVVVQWTLSSMEAFLESNELLLMQYKRSTNVELIVFSGSQFLFPLCLTQSWWAAASSAN